MFPYFLFTGVLVERIYRQTDEVAARHPEIEFLKAGYLDDHPLVLDAFIERIEGIRTADVNMNCLLCKYREQIIGHEAAVGAPQEGHHHHVEGIGTHGVMAITHHHGTATITRMTIDHHHHAGMSGRTAPAAGAVVAAMPARIRAAICAIRPRSIGSRSPRSGARRRSIGCRTTCSRWRCA